MNAALQKALRAVAALPEADQIEVAEGLMAYVDLIKSGEPLLSPEQRAGVEAARAQALAGAFATDEEMAETWRNFEA
jgi:hypothetical protein